MPLKNRVSPLVHAALLLAALASSAAALLPADNSDPDAVDPDTGISAQDFFYQRREQLDGSFPPEARALGLAAKNLLGVSALLGGGAPTGGGGRGMRGPLGTIVTQTITTPWTFVGPQPATGSATANYGFGAASGRINAIAVHPTDPNTLYIGTAWGGVAKSTDGGIDWTFETASLPSQSITTIAIDTTNPNIVYAGTGDPYYDGHGVSLLGVGVYRTVDAGTTWTKISGANALGGGVVQKVAIDPTTSGSQTTTRVYAAVSVGTAYGFYRSLDSGQTWSNTLSDYVYDIVVDTMNPGTVYLQGAGGTRKSTNYGASWGAVILNNVVGYAYKSRLAMAGSNLYVALSTGLYANATFGASTQQGGQLLRSTNGGTSWTDLTAAHGFCSTQCLYDIYVAVDPSNANHLFVGGVDASSSVNAGASFTDFAPFNPPKMIMHSDHHSIAFAPSSPSTIYEGNDGGLYKSVNGGTTWANMNANLAGGLVMGVSVSGDGKMVVGLQDNGSLVYQNTASTAWSAYYGGDGGFAKIDPGNSQRMYSTYVVSAKVPANTIYRSVNGGAGTTDITPAAVVNVETGMFYPAISISSDAGGRLMAGFQNVYGSANNGTSWTRIGPTGTLDGTNNISAIAEGAADLSVIYAGTTGNKVFITTTATSGNSAAWTQSTSGLPTTQLPTAFATHPTNSAIAYVTFSQYGTVASPMSHVYKTVNGGASWTVASAGLPDVPFNDILIDTSAPQNVIAASDVGVFNSIDGGATWTQSDVGIPQGMVVNSLSFNAATRELVAGTYGLGAYKITLPPPPPAPTAIGVAQGVSSITWSWSASPASYNVQAYGVYYATNPTVLITSGAATSFTWTGLQVNATCAIQVTAANGVLESANSASAQTSTLANAPASVKLTGVYVSSAALSWTANGNPAGTLFEARISTDNFATLNASSQTLATSATFFALAPNTTYYLGVATLNRDALPQGFTALAATSTFAAPPAAAAASGVTTTQITANWGSGGNGPGTLYTAQISTDNFATVNASSLTFNSSATFTSLLTNTTYYFQARAKGNNGQSTAYVAIASTMTAGFPPAAAAFTGVGSSAITANWGANGNIAGTSYFADISTDAFATIVKSSTTLNLFATFTGLNINTTYFLRVAALSGTGQTSATPLGSTTTLAAAPTAAALSGVVATTVAANWGANGNPAGTVYLAEISTNAFATLVNSSSTLGVSATFFALTPNTSYALRVKALNSAGTPSSSASLGSTTTFANAPVSAAVSGLGVAALTANWGANGDPAGTTYVADVSTDAFATLVNSSTTLNVSATFSGLTSNTGYALRVKALNSAGTATSSTPLGSTSTLVNSPTPGLISGVGAAALSVGWGANGAPAGTVYLAEASTDAFATIVVSSSTLNVSASFSALTPNTTYTLRVKAFNSGGTPTPPAALGSTTTWAAAPAAALPTLGATFLTAVWGANGNSAGTVYVANISTDNFSTLNNSSTTLNVSATFSGLTSDTSYYLRVKAVNAAGLATSWTSLGSTYTFLNSPTPSPITGVGLSALTANWGANGDSPATIYVAAVSTDGFATLVNSSSTRNLFAAFSGLTLNTSYALQVQALNSVGTPTLPVSLGSTATLANAPVSAALSSAGATFLTANWGANGDPAGTTYVADVSTDGFATLVNSSATLNVSATLSGLTPNTGFSLRVKAVNLGGTPTSLTALGSTTTLAAAAAAAPVTGLGVAALTMNWSANGNPAGTNYVAALSTDGFATIVNSSATLGLLAAFSGLSVNTNYGLRVTAFNSAGTPTASVLGATATLANAPSAAPLSGVVATALAANWGANGDPAGTTYAADVSTDGFATLVNSSATLNVSATLSGLTPNTNYAVRAKALNLTGTPTTFVPLGSTTTLAAAPAAAAASGLGAATLTANWGANGDPAGTAYVAALSTDAFATLVNSSSTLNLFAAFSGLTGNTSYAMRVKAVNAAGTATSWTALGSTTTLVNSPAPGSISGVGTAALTANWGANGDPAGTAYLAEISTDGFATLVNSLTTISLSAPFTALTPNTNYALQVKALNAAGTPTPPVALGSTVTLAAPPSAAAASGVGVTVLTLNWGAAGNPSGTLYAADLSTDAFATLVVTSATLNVSAAFSGLTPNTSYTLRARAFNSGGTPTAPVSLGSAVTLANAPTAAAISNVGVSSLTANWGANGDPAGTTYVADISTDGFATLVNSSATKNLAATFAALASNTTHFLRVKAVNLAGVPTSATALGWAASDVNAPSPAPSSGIGLSALTANWGAAGNSQGTIYVADISIDGFATVVDSSQTLNTFATFANLGVNTTYFLRVAALNPAGLPTAPTDLGWSATLADDPSPVGQPFSGQALDGFTYSFGRTGNPTDTTYVVKASSSPVFSTVSAAIYTQSTAVSFTGLPSNQLYYVAVAALNRIGLQSAFTAPTATATTVAAPVALAAPVSTRTLTALGVMWDPGTLAPGTSYFAELSSDPSFSAGVQSTTVTAAAAAFSGLSSNTLYYARVRALSRNAPTPDGPATVVAAASTLTLAPRAAAATFSNVNFTSFTVAWIRLSTTPITAAAEGYAVEVSTTADFSVFGASVAVAENFSSACVSGLTPLLTYYARVGSLNWDGVGNYTVVGSTNTQPPAPFSGGTTSSSGLSLAIVSVVPQVRWFGVNVPPGAFPPGTAIHMSAAPGVDLTGARSNEAPITPLGFGVGFDLSAAGLQPATPVRVTVPYDPTLIPAGQDEKRLSLMRFDTASLQWTLVPSSVDVSTHALTAFVQHFSIFAPFFITPSAVANLAAMQVFPQPWEIGGDSRSLYWASALTLSSLPSAAHVRFLTLTGELVWEGDASNGGVLTWDGSNRSGHKVGSGTYLAVIEADGARRVRRVVLIR